MVCISGLSVFSSASLLFWKHWQETRGRKKSEGTVFSPCVLLAGFCGLTLSLLQRTVLSGGISIQSLFPGSFAASSICPFRRVCHTSLLVALRQTSLYLVSLKPPHPFLNSPFIKSPQITPFKHIPCVPSQTLSGLTVKCIYISTCFCSPNLSSSIPPTRVHIVFQPVFWFQFPKGQFYSHFVMGKFMLFFLIIQKSTREKP